MVRKNRFLTIKPGTPDERFAHVEQIIGRMRRKLGKVITVVVPPSPIYGYVEKPMDGGVIMKCVLPADGDISRVCLAISEYTDNQRVEFEVDIRKFTIHGESSGSQSIRFSTRKHVIVENVLTDVSIGDCLTLSTLEPEKIRGIWVTLLYNIKMPEGQIKKIPWDELDKLIGEDLDEGV